MLFWILAALLTLVAALAVMRPFAARRPATAASTAYDIEVYRDQLNELARDVERGLIGPEEAEQARAEIGRRILKVSEGADEPAGTGEGRLLVRLTAAAAIAAVPLISWGVYTVIGSPGMPSQPLQARLQQDPANASIEELVGRAEAHLADNPQDVRGWQVLAPVYMRLGRFADAETALRNIIRLSAATAELQAALGEVITARAQGLVTADAEAAFQEALALDVQNPKARFFIALARAQEGMMDDARDAWRAMQADLPEGSPWREAAAQALASGADEQAPGPTSEDVAAASQMSQDDRQSMVAGMVARLDEKLRENPADPEGWRRLVRSYMVLEKPDEARSALERGMSALGANTAEGRELLTFAKGLGVEIE
ncbi:c-type cytochrome biogenesis protein CcmI [Nitratireductor sp. ZSWI3]|uniref:c-type cytochrome biogenesis protein CcmI n=1 Tax=Nitratireductor sp. ZSWI3 TaxID=2966359 RepID=UPI0021501B8D|nr:c-type cytochrome biogenesis protein CcmI [Nitratireductor sp. ZSWI3]MCR4268378.1 c-type cytochrome biogenesis protein CcmI [Nitratireductor sp. ZSWI3]